MSLLKKWHKERAKNANRSVEPVKATPTPKPIVADTPKVRSSSSGEGKREDGASEKKVDKVSPSKETLA